MIRAREHKYYPYKEEVDIVEWPKIPERKPLEDGQVFDLGGRTLTFYECGGHTPGEMVVIDDKTVFYSAGMHAIIICCSDLDLENRDSSAQRKPGRIWNGSGT